MKTSPTQRSLAKLRAEGWTVRVVEHWNQYARIRQDLFGFGDLIAVKVGVPGATLVQTTTGHNLSARIAKIYGIPEAGIWKAAGNRIVAHGWRKVGERGKRKLWECREVEI